MADGRMPCDAATCAGFDPATQRCLPYPPTGPGYGTALLCPACFTVTAAADGLDVTAQAAEVAATGVHGPAPCVVRRQTGALGRLVVCVNPATWRLKSPGDPDFAFEVAGAAGAGCAFSPAHVTRAGGRPTACDGCFMRVRAAAVDAKQAHASAAPGSGSASLSSQGRSSGVGGGGVADGLLAHGGSGRGGDGGAADHSHRGTGAGAGGGAGITAEGLGTRVHPRARTRAAPPVVERAADGGGSSVGGAALATSEPRGAADPPRRRIAT
jgi:hypothetical protein